MRRAYPDHEKFWITMRQKKKIFYKQQKILGPPHSPYYVYQRQHLWRKYNELWWRECWID